MIKKPFAVFVLQKNLLSNAISRLTLEKNPSNVRTQAVTVNLLIGQTSDVMCNEHIEAMAEIEKRRVSV